MEFEIVDGVVKYCGLSLFQTIKGAYAGNVLASEEEKEEILASYVSLDKLAQIRQHIIEILQPVLKSIYSGPFGVDMMIYADDERRLQINPCVELNLRRTMGHVALSLGASEKRPDILCRLVLMVTNIACGFYQACLLNLLLIIKSTIILYKQLKT